MRKEYDFSKAKLVVPPIDRRKTRITIRIDTKTLNWFRQRVHGAGGGNYQTMINEALKSYIESENAKTIRYPGGPHVELDDKFQRECEAEGLEFQGRGYFFDFKNHKYIRDLGFTREKAA
ncbi:MAG: BrnA antitoxin family protein [Deltaproteobacteria bacterium]|nr:BrnA antitoxin family protein [Deltaproteobacteria bacterium]